jgi:hypothetical protein
MHLIGSYSFRTVRQHVEYEEHVLVSCSVYSWILSAT